MFRKIAQNSGGYLLLNMNLIVSLQYISSNTDIAHNDLQWVWSSYIIQQDSLISSQRLSARHI